MSLPCPCNLFMQCCTIRGELQRCAHCGEVKKYEFVEALRERVFIDEGNAYRKPYAFDEVQTAELKQQYENGASVKSLASEYGVSMSTVRRYLKKES